MPDPTNDPQDSRGGQPLDVPLIREFDDRSSLWLLEDPMLLRGLLQILDPSLVERLDFAHARRINRSFIPADLQKEESDLVYAVPFRGRGREVWVYVWFLSQLVSRGRNDRSWIRCWRKRAAPSFASERGSSRWA
jgi:hypothetical protein